MYEALIAAGGGVLVAIVSKILDMLRDRRAAREQRLRLDADQSTEIRRAELEAAGLTQGRLLDRIDKLEARVDEHDRDCDRKIAAAIEKSETDCLREMERREHRLREEWQIKFVEWQRYSEAEDG